MEGERGNYIGQRVEATGKSVEEVLEDMIREVQAAIGIIDSVLKGLEKEAWTSFMFGYLYFHVQSDRYRLRELNISM